METENTNHGATIGVEIVEAPTNHRQEVAEQDREKPPFEFFLFDWQLKNNVSAESMRDLLEGMKAYNVGITSVYLEKHLERSHQIVTPTPEILSIGGITSYF